MTLTDGLQRSLTRMSGALTDPARRDRAVVVLLLAYVATWTLYGSLAKGSQDLHADMTEIFAWSRELALGYAKHPPLAPYLVRLWFLIFPAADWAYYCLAITIAALTLWIAWRIALRYLDAFKSAASMLLLTFIPFFNFHALKFNANTVLMPVWAATTLWFLISLETRSRSYALLAGAGAALAMLGKYWSIFLLLGLGVTALLDAGRRDYFRSSAPYLTVAAGALVLAPHVMWLLANDFAPFSYAVTLHGAKSFVSSTLAALGYLGGSIGYIAFPVVFAGLVLRPSVPALRDTLWPDSIARRRIALAFWLPFLLPALLAPLSGTMLNSLWSMPAWALFGIVLLSSPRIDVTQRALSQILAVALVLPPLMTIAAPGIAYVLHRNSTNPWQAQTSLLAPEVERLWRETSGAPLRWVCGDGGLAYGVSFYAAARPIACGGMADLAAGPGSAIAREGVVLVCFEVHSCKPAIDRLSREFPQTRMRTVELTRTVMGLAGPRERYVIAAVPPR